MPEDGQVAVEVTWWVPEVFQVHRQWGRGVSGEGECPGPGALMSSPPQMSLLGRQNGVKCSGAPQSCFQIPPMLLPGWVLENKPSECFDLSFSALGFKHPFGVPP